jgi:DNA polymerase-3 subunit delta'
MMAPWIERQLSQLLQRQGHAWLLQGPSGLGQFELGLALAKAWLCEQPTPQGACGTCSSCHAVEVHTHADMHALLPETLMVDLRVAAARKGAKGT